MASNTSSSQTHLSIFFIPWYATGHLIPMADIASLFASRGVSSTILTTPANAALIQPTINHLCSSSSLPIRTLLYPFPSSLSDLPPNAENIASVSAADAHKFDVAATLHSRPAIESLVRLHRPNAVIADIHFTWFFELAAELNIPFLVFHAIGLFPTAVLHALIASPPQYDADEDNKSFLVPGLPHTIHVAQSELPAFFLKGFVPTTDNTEEPVWSKLLEMEAKSFGFVVNSFPEIDSEYADYFLNVYGKQSWLVGPVAAATTTTTSNTQNEQLLAVRGGKEDGNSDRCLAWLDTQLPTSVVYVCFGSWCHFSDEQIRQLALGLESCSHPFLWVVREDSAGYLPQGFEERVIRGKGLVVRGWAPQSAVLGHIAVGGFLTHCGWNSLLEGLAAGLPMATWPLVFEQFINEKLVTEMLRIGVKCRGGVGSMVEEEKAVVTQEEVAAAVGRIMSEEEEAAAMRRRAKEYATKAKEAVRKGGSSYNGLTSVIQELKAWTISNKNI